MRRPTRGAAPTGSAMTSRRASYAERRARADARRAERAEIDDPAVVLEAAAAFLAVRPRSIDETRRRLVGRGYPSASVDIVIERLLEFGYLDDEAFARAWVESRDWARPRGELALRRELLLKRVDRDVIARVLAHRAAGDDGTEQPGERSMPGPVGSAEAGATAEDADEVAARSLLVRRRASIAREADPRRRRQKAYALLARNGFAPDVCARVSAESVAAEDEDDASEASADGV